MLLMHPFIHGPPSQHMQTQFQGPAGMPPFSLQGPAGMPPSSLQDTLLHNPASDMVHQESATTPSTQQQRYPGANMVVPTTSIDISVPLNTGVVGGRVSRVQIRLPVNITFEDFFSRICAKMDLDPVNAELGYKFHNDRVRDAPHQLSNEQQLQEAFEQGCDLIKRARSRRVVLEIHNLKPACQAPSATLSRRDEAVNDNQDPPTCMSFAAELQELKNKLDCEKHGKFCYINPINIYNLTLWAKKIFLAEATYDKPPEMAAFHHVPKKRRLSSANGPSANSATPTLLVIHVHIPPVTKEALGDTGGRRRVNTSQGFATTFLCHDEDDEFITYPPITDVLCEMDVTMPLLHMSQYEDDLLNHGVAYVNSMIGLSDEFFVNVVGMPMGVIRSFLKVTHRLIQHAKKGKGRATNNDDKENYSAQCCYIVDDQEEFVVEEVLDSRQFRGKVQYRVKWKGYPIEESTWEPEENVKNSPILIAEFHKKNPTAAKPKRILGSILDMEEFKQWRKKNIRPSYIHDDAHPREGVMSRIPNTNHYSFLNTRETSKDICETTVKCPSQAPVVSAQSASVPITFKGPKTTI
ncbi:hypothetical protein DFJ58DRAFT_734999 [Suillus subalutaceus]|uniref:uncharacterized protein n=1 Tax=Suillus subalutaceus TaxID=48586 RepID=UPI001B87087D|nr:uncharacterized protein DFJ58DRAFT_734999 [Suillus subalutaceus]KAG1836402.1 hypothetical protein DFJ58DRAFT_734999 [Suillus subalutaceus]